MFCPECGKEIADSSKFCLECGAKIEGTNNQVVKAEKASKFATPVASFIALFFDGIFTLLGYAFLKFFANYAQTLMNSNVSKLTRSGFEKHKAFGTMLQNLDLYLLPLLILSISLVAIAIWVLALKKKIKKNTLRFISLITGIFSIGCVYMACYPFFHSF
ncbi:MAG: zinc-ribbon domain-containing protein [Ruminococcaceae bacterium]|nr:zinc-ribbon domain-containing protein [Oscillospiraceae bacterium]